MHAKVTRRAGRWKEAVPVFAELGFQCPQFKNPTDYFMKVASDTDNIPALVQAQQHRWTQNGSEKFSSRAVTPEEAEAGMGALLPAFLTCILLLVYFMLC